MTEQTKNFKNPIHVLISGAAGQIGYALIPLVANGSMFGKEQPLILHLLDITPAMKVLQGVVMEISDCSYPLVEKIIATDDYAIAFKDIDYALLIGGMPRRKGMERKDLLQSNAKIYIDTGKALNQYAKKSVKVVVVANPANTNALILSQNAPSIPKTNITALSRLDMNRAVAFLSSNLGVQPRDLKNVVIQGNHSKTQLPYANNAIYGQTKNLVVDMLKEKGFEIEQFLTCEFVDTIQNRGAEVIKARGLSSAMSAAKAVCDHMNTQVFGTQPGEYVSMCVSSDENPYGIESGLVFSFPVQIENGQYKIVKGLQFNEIQKRLLEKTENELIEERKEVKKEDSSEQSSSNL